MNQIKSVESFCSNCPPNHYLYLNKGGICIAPIHCVISGRWERIQHFFGYGPAGYWTLCSAIERIAEENIKQLFTPEIREIFNTEPSKMPFHKYKELVGLSETIKQIRQVKINLMDNVLASIFFKSKTLAGQCFYIAAVFFRVITVDLPLDLKNNIKAMFRPHEISLEERLTEVILDKEQCVCKCTAAIWQGENINHNQLQLSLSSTGRLHTLHVFKDDKEIGVATFLTDTESKKMTIASYRPRGIDAKILLSRYLQSLSALLKDQGIETEKTLLMGQPTQTVFQAIDFDEGVKFKNVKYNEEAWEEADMQTVQNADIQLMHNLHKAAVLMK